ncbi:hypothetical protein, partial [Alteromonas macleodii]
MTDKPSFTQTQIAEAIADPASLVELSGAIELQQQEEEIHDFLKDSPTTKLAELIGKCMAIVDLCDPSKTLEKPNIMMRKFREFTGKDLAIKVEYTASVKEMDGILDEAKTQATRIESAFKNISIHIEGLKAKATELAHNAALGQFIIDHHLNEVEEVQHSLLQRRVANLTAMLTANELAMEQFKLAQKNALMIVHRFEEMQTMVLPSWKSLTMQRDLSRELTPSQGVQVKQIYTNIRSDLNELSVML